jgi:hypothetical protein
MAKNIDTGARTVELLRTLTIVQLGLAGVGQAQIRKIVGGSMNDINGIVKLLQPNKQRRQANDRQ